MNPNLDPTATASFTDLPVLAAVGKRRRRRRVAALLNTAALLSTTAPLAAMDVPKKPSGAGD
jgi:hypothetical protein